MPQHQHLLVTGARPRRHRRLEVSIQPPPPPLRPGLPAASPLRRQLQPPIDPQSSENSDAPCDPVTPSAATRVREVDETPVVVCGTILQTRRKDWPPHPPA